LAGGIAQGHHFGVRTASGLGLALADHFAIGRHQNAAHCRVRRGLVLCLLGKLKGEVDHGIEFSVQKMCT
jgi:hypothetical protein